MTQLVALDQSQHQGLKLLSQRAELHGADVNMLPALLPEFANLAVEYPVVFSKNGDTGQFVCVALFGFQSGENLFWQEGRWQAMYLPMQIQRQPFFIGNDDAMTLCIDTDSPTLSEHEGEALFTESGDDSPYLQQAKQRLADIMNAEQSNAAFIDKVQSLDLLQPMTLEIVFQNGQQSRLNGLYTIDTEKLEQLSDENIVSLQREGHLQAIHIMQMSMGQIYRLIDLKNQRVGA